MKVKHHSRITSALLTGAAAGILSAALVNAEPAAVTTASLLGEMTDLAGMASFPEPAYTCRQFSSYDRNAKSPGEDWFANGDCGQYLAPRRTGAARST